MQDSQHGTLPISPSRKVFVLRLLSGVLQGVALYWLTDVAHHHDRIAALSLLFFPLFLVTVFIPTVLIVGLPRFRTARLVIWLAALGAVVALLGYHDAWRSAGTVLPKLASPGDVLPSSVVIVFSGLMVFVVYCLILAGETARSWRVPYESYFEISWKLGLQMGLSGLFVGALFLVLSLGGKLFMLLNLHFLSDLLSDTWFDLPIGSIAFASALHITDVRPDIIRGSRTLVLSLLSWLLLVLVVIVGGFLVTLPFTGLQPLWDTRSATWLLLGVAAAMVFLVNTVFKGGPGAEPVSCVLRLCMRISCLMLPVLVVLATYALALRIGQYGLTPSRVLACAVVSVACLYALGYAWAALGRSDGLARIAPVNVIAAWVSLAVLVAVFTPLADPARLSVASQVARLLAGNVTPEKFDYGFLRDRSERYGREALTRLEHETRSSHAATIRELSTQAAARSPDEAFEIIRPDATTLARNIVSRTAGQAVPASFFSTDWAKSKQSWMFPDCLNSSAETCDAYLIQLGGDPQPDVVLLPTAKISEATGFVFHQDRDGGWRLAGKFATTPDCQTIRAALAQGTFLIVKPQLQDLQINGRRVVIEATPEQSDVCAS